MSNTNRECEVSQAEVVSAGRPIRFSSRHHIMRAEEVVDLDRYPLHRSDSREYQELVARCHGLLQKEGLFQLPGFMRPGAIQNALASQASMVHQAFYHSRRHNIFFQDAVPGLPDDHVALKHFAEPTTNRILCADQIEGTAVTVLYDWQPFAKFLACTMHKPALFTMDDRIAGANVVTYHEGDGLNYHFDRAEFTTTLLLQQPEAGGVFEYCRDLCGSPGQPNAAFVAELLSGVKLPQRCPQAAGTLTVFCGQNTAHRVTPVKGKQHRINCVLTFTETPGCRFTAEDHYAFYGRTLGVAAANVMDSKL